MANNCYKLFILNGPNGVTQVPIDGSVVSVKNRGAFSNINEVQVDGLFSFNLPMDHPGVEAIMNRAWCPGLSLLDQEPYKIRLMIGHEIQPQKWLYCGNLNEGGKTFGVSARWGKDNFITGANEIKLCDIFKFELPDIVNGGTFETCDNVQLGVGIIGIGDDPWQQSTDNCEYEDGVSDPYLMLPSYYGGLLYGDTMTPADFRPWFHIRYVLKLGACKIGWKIKAPILDNSMFDRAWTYILSNNYGNQAFINQYGSLEAAFEAHRWKVAMTPGSILGEGCQTFDSIIADPQGVINTGFPSLPWTYITKYRDLFQGVCLRMKLFQTNENWEGEICVRVYEYSGEYATGQVPTPAGTTITTLNPVSNQIIENTYDISFDDDNPSFIVEDTIEIGCVNIDKPTVLNSGYLAVCVEFKPNGNTQAGQVPVFEVEYFEFFNKPKEFFYGIGDVVRFCDAVTCDKTYLDYVKMVASLFGGLVDIDPISQTVCLFPPVTIEMPDGEIIEGYDNNEPAVKIEGLIICDTLSAIKNNEQPRFCRIGFARSTDSLINELYEGDDQPYSYLIDRGEQYDSSQTVSKLNHGFEPTILRRVENLSCNGVPVYLPNLSDNEDGEVSKNIGCRLILCSDGSQDFQGTGQVPEIPYCDTFQNNGAQVKITQFVQGYQKPNDSQIITADPAEIISYNPEDNEDPTNINALFDFYNLFLRHSNLDSLGAPMFSFQFFHCENLFMRDDGGYFRRKVRIDYRGKSYKLTPTQFQEDQCSLECTITGYQPNILNAECLTNQAIDVQNCLNSASISCDFNKETNCYTFLANGNYSSPIQQIIWEQQEEISPGVFGSSTNPAGSLTMLELCNLTSSTRVRFQVIFDVLDGVQCEPVLSNWIVKDPCPNFPIVECVDVIEKIDPCENCFKLKISGIVCSNIESITGTLKIYETLPTDTDPGVLLNSIPISLGSIDEIEPLDFISEEICGAGPCFLVDDGLINYQDGCSPTEWGLQKIFKDCCCDLSGSCKDCVYKFDELCGYKVQWYMVKGATDPNVVPYGLTAEAATIDDLIKEELICSYPIYGPDQVEFDDQIKNWYVAVLTKTNESKVEEEEVEACPCILWPYFHNPFISGGNPGGYAPPVFEERPNK